MALRNAEPSLSSAYSLIVKSLSKLNYKYKVKFNTNNNMSKIIAYDLGTNSIGWSIREDQKEGNQILNAGVVTFNKGVGEEKNIEYIRFYMPRKHNKLDGREPILKEDKITKEFIEELKSEQRLKDTLDYQTKLAKYNEYDVAMKAGHTYLFSAN